MNSDPCISALKACCVQPTKRVYYIIRLDGPNIVKGLSRFGFDETRNIAEAWQFSTVQSALDAITVRTVRFCTDGVSEANASRKMSIIRVEETITPGTTETREVQPGEIVPVDAKWVVKYEDGAGKTYLTSEGADLGWSPVLSKARTYSSRDEARLGYARRAVAVDYIINVQYVQVITSTSKPVTHISETVLK